MKKNNRPLTITIQQSPGQSHSDSKYLASVPSQSHRIQTDDDKFGQNEKNIKIVQFQQFVVEDNHIEKQKNKIKPSHDLSITLPAKPKNIKEKKDFSIDVSQISNRSHHNTNKTPTDRVFKQPVAPSHKGSYQSKNFNFPIVELKKQEKKHDISTQQMSKAFERQRQQFYRQKSDYQKQLMIKQGQIQMLQKMITNILGAQQSIKSVQQFESLILQKDLQISQMLQKIKQLCDQLSSKSQQIRNTKIQCLKLQSINQTLLNQIYVLEKSQNNKKSTQQFYDIARQKPSTPTSRQDTRIRYPGLDSLERRLQNLQINRYQLQQRGKIKSQVTYTHSGKYKRPQIKFPQYSRIPNY